MPSAINRLPLWPVKELCCEVEAIANNDQTCSANIASASSLQEQPQRP